MDGLVGPDSCDELQAIQAALDKKAAIISMSWTIPMAEGDSEAKKRREFSAPPCFFNYYLVVTVFDAYPCSA